jgi:hypothetical protein
MKAFPPVNSSSCVYKNTIQYNTIPYNTKNTIPICAAAEIQMEEI